MIDIHSHILPGIDDGSKNLRMSMGLIDMLIDQGIDTVAATPHFYADRVSVEKFLSRRQRAYESLAEALEKEPKALRILLGAEVAYYSGISSLEGLDSLCIGDSGTLLLEMPLSAWSEYMISEVLNISCSGITVVIAHIERSLPRQKKENIWRLIENGVVIQSNASFFNSVVTRGKAMRLLRSGFIHLLGSDCHNLTDRPPAIGSAYEHIEKKLGRSYVERISETGNALLGL